MNTKDTPEYLRALLANALPAQTHLPVVVGTEFIPLLWVDGRASHDAMLLQERLTSLGTCLGQLPEGELEKVYGQRWIYAYGTANAFFLHVIVDAPSFTVPVAVPSLHAEVAVRFSLNDSSVRLLRVIADSRRVLLHFDAELGWVQHLPPLQGNERAKDMGERGLALVRSSLYLLFRPELIARMVSQLDVWERTFGQGSR